MSRDQLQATAKFEFLFFHSLRSWSRETFFYKVRTTDGLLSYPEQPLELNNSGHRFTT